MTDRICEPCGEPIVDGEPDPCLGRIEGVEGACCGHGDHTKAYVALRTVAGHSVVWSDGFTKWVSENDHMVWRDDLSLRVRPA